MHTIEEGAVGVRDLGKRPTRARDRAVAASWPR
jgi:hypothetical protein